MWDKFLNKSARGLRPTKVGAATVVTDCVETPSPECVEVSVV